MSNTVPTPEKRGQKPGLWQIMTEKGGFKKGRKPKDLSKEDYLTLYRYMSLVRSIDSRMLTLQRQGRISFYGTATGQEAAVIGSGYGLESEDWILPALREGGVALLRGYPLSDYVNQVFCNGADIEKGRQMPCHYGDNRVNYVTLSSNIATQLPHAVGVAMAQKAQGHKAITIGYMGDGATSEGDFHVAMEFAARLNAPVLLFCQNNQWAISTGADKQTRARSLAAKAEGYGMPGYRVDGNDVLACVDITRRARQEILETGGPVFVEALTYRVGAHSTSDDPSRYRDESITEQWKKKDPIERFRRCITKLGYWSDTDEEAMIKEYDAQIRAEINRAESEAAPTVDTLFEDVYSEMPWHLREQKDALMDVVSKRKELLQSGHH